VSSQANAKISATGGPTTAALVARAGAGDRDAFATLYNEHRPAVYRYLLNRTRNQHLAEDLTSETFVRALRRIDTFAERAATGGIGGWLYTIARNLHTDHLKTAYHYRETQTSVLPGEDEQYSLLEWLAGPVDSAETSALRGLASVEIAAAIRDALAGLTEAQRQCFQMRYLQELPIPQAAAALGKGIGATKTLQFRATQRVRQALADKGVAA
jgi:RNA polymerase sigma-70 factor (ECF subfamily)